MILLAFSHPAGIRMAEVGFLFMLAAGVLLALRLPLGRTAAGVALAVGAALLLIATHSGHFGA